LQNRQNTELAWTARQKKISAPAISPGFQIELTGSLSLRHSAMATVS